MFKGVNHVPVWGRAFPAEEPSTAWFFLGRRRGHGAGEQSSGRGSEIMDGVLGTRAFTLSEEGSVQGAVS